MKQNIFTMLLLSHIYSTVVNIGGIKLSMKRHKPLSNQELVRELEMLDLNANSSNNFNYFGPIFFNNEQQIRILNSDVLKIITMLPYTPFALSIGVINTGGQNNLELTWGDIIHKLKEKLSKAEKASMLPINYFFPSYNIKDPLSVLKSQRPDENKDALASFGADLVICYMPETRVFKENQVIDTFQSAHVFLDVKNYKIFENIDRDLYGNYAPSNPEKNRLTTNQMIRISRVRYAVATFLQYTLEGKLQQNFRYWKGI